MAAELSKAEVIQSNKLLGHVLGVDTIHHLIELFDTGRIAEYIQQERFIHHLDPNHVEIESKLYGTNDENTSLLIIIRKHGKPFIHLSIHVAPKTLKKGNKEKGVVHIYKDIYDKFIDKSKPYLLYAIYYLQQVENEPIDESKNQPKSITFSIGYGYSTPIYPDAPQDYIDNVERYDDEVKQEIDVITSVLNKLFDRHNKEYYIGDSKNMYEINNKLMTVLNNINKRQKHISRKNKGLMFNQSTNQSMIIPRNQIGYSPKRKIKKKKNTRKKSNTVSNRV